MENRLDPADERTTISAKRKQRGAETGKKNTRFANYVTGDDEFSGEDSGIQAAERREVLTCSFVVKNMKREGARSEGGERDSLVSRCSTSKKMHVAAL